MPEVITYYLKRFSITQDELAKKLNVSLPTVSRWENGNGTPNRKARMAFDLLCKESDIVFEEDEK